jgi:tetratricopeptide (TPR) repeat protein
VPVRATHHGDQEAALGKRIELVCDRRQRRIGRRNELRTFGIGDIKEEDLVLAFENADDEALELSRKAIQTEPSLAHPYDDLGRALLEKGFSAEAIAALEQAVSLSNRGTRFLSSLGYGYGVTGRKGLALEILAELTERSKQGHVASSDFAFVNAGLGERDQAIYWLERDCDERDFPRCRSSTGEPAHRPAV